MHLPWNDHYGHYGRQQVQDLTVIGHRKQRQVRQQFNDFSTSRRDSARQLAMTKGRVFTWSDSSNPYSEPVDFGAAGIAPNDHGEQQALRS
jgi:hypothetical protein